MSDLRGFAQRMLVIAKNVSLNSDALTRKVALAVDGAVVIATPVDTGRARSNWIVEIGSASNDINEEFGPHNSNGALGTRRALDQGAATIGTYQKGEVIHITNNLPYIEALNDGTSAQAPANFVQEAVQAGVDTIGDARITVNT